MDTSPTLTGYASEFDPAKGLVPVELGEVIIRGTPEELRSLAAHIEQAATALEVSGRHIHPFTFADALAPRNTPSQVIIEGRKT